MKLLVVGSGGREHALVEKLHRDAPGARLFAAPGNPGMEQLARRVPIPSTELDALVAFADEESVDLTVVGPEGPLAAGLADRFAEAGLAVFGPSRRAARIESSKAFAKDLMADLGVPTARHRTFDSLEPALEHLEGLEPPVVVKASGLAAGKGALVCREKEGARSALTAMLRERRFGDAGERVVIEEFLRGRELSVFYLCDGERAVPLAASRDHKRLEEGDRGPTTGGMGAYTPVSDATSGLLARVHEEIARPVVRGLAERGMPYRGVLYAGLMLTEEGPRVLEFNCRFGDPEAQVVLPLVRSDLVEPLRAVAAGEGLEGWTPELDDGAALVTVLASGGYPREYETGKVISVPEDLEGPDLRVYHAGTARVDGRLVTDGGRVLGVTGLGGDLGTAAERSRAGARRIHFDGCTWRSDIGHAELERV